MNIYNAIMKAADYIEQNPGLFNFGRVVVPECGTPGCAIGWIAYFHGEERGSSVAFRKVIKPLVGVNDGVLFYDEMNRLVGPAWKKDSSLCAKGLRLFAARFSAPDKPERTDFIPAEIRALFTTVQHERI